MTMFDTLPYPMFKSVKSTSSVLERRLVPSCKDRITGGDKKPESDVKEEEQADKDDIRSESSDQVDCKLISMGVAALE
jgi:hypothetical protein